MRKLTLVLFVGLLGSGLLWAQRVTSTLSGTITDPSGAVIPQANVSATQVSTGAETKSVSDSHGYFILNNLAPGEYTLQVTCRGFQTYVQPGITLLVDQSVTVSVTLTVGSETQRVTVAGVASQVNVVSSTLETQVTTAMTTNLPLNGRNIMQLMTLAPDTGPSNGAGYFQFGSSMPNSSVFVAASGGRGDSVNYYLDGALNEDDYSTVANSYPNPDAIEEFTFETNNYSAKFGGRAGGVMNAVTRGGSNQFHGTAFDYVRYFSLNARNFFSPTQDGLKRNQYGGTVGGPIQKDKTFFFFSWQQTPVRSTPSENVAFVPTASEENGNFASECPGGFTAGLCNTGGGTQLSNPTTGQPFLNNQIPTTLFDPVAKKLWSQYLPVGPAPSGEIFYPSVTRTDERQFIARVDRNFGNKFRLYGSYIYDSDNVPTVPVGQDILTVTVPVYYRSQTGVLNLAYTFNPHFMTTVAGSLARRQAVGADPAGWPSWIDLGVHIPDLLETHGNHKSLFGNVAGYFGPFGYENALLSTPSTAGDVTNNWTYVRGGHTVEFGGEWNPAKVLIDADSLAGGYFTFTNSLSGDNLADFMLGAASEFFQGGDEYAVSPRTLWGLYITDNWKVTRKLSLNGGIRWNPYVPWDEISQHENVLFSLKDYNAGIHSTRFPNLPPGYLVEGDPGVPKAGIPADYHLFTPRLGFAYDLFGNGRTSIRGGFGIFIGQQSMNFATDTGLSYLPFTFQSEAKYTVPSMSFPYGPTLPTFSFPPTSSTVFPLPLSSQPWVAGYMPMIVEQWNLAVEHQLAGHMVLRVDYQGSHTYHEPSMVDGNAAVYNPALTPAQNLATTQQRRPMAADFATFQLQGGQQGNAEYNGLTVSVTRQVARGLTFIGGYRWSKCMEDPVTWGESDESEYSTPHGYKARFDWGPCTYDVDKKLTFSYVWALPSVKSLGFVGHHVLGGWQSSGILTWQSGEPLEIFSGVDNSFTAIGQDHADVVGKINLVGNRSTGAKVAEWFNTAAFAENAYGTFGDAAPGDVRGPGLANFDFSMIKSIPIARGPFKETQHLDFRAEFFNLFNHPNFGAPGNTVNAPSTFGVITSANPGRIIQLALKFVF